MHNDLLHLPVRKGQQASRRTRRCRHSGEQNRDDVIIVAIVCIGSFMGQLDASITQHHPKRW
jgi:hypothetical protein